MRHFYLFFCTFLTYSLFSQSPPYINYQGVARNSAGEPYVNKNIGLKFDIRQGSATGNVVFSESQSVSTGNLGVFSVRIGTTTSQGVSAIDWKTGDFFLQISIDTSNSQNYTSLGVQQIISVPYAMHAASVPASFTNNVLSVGTQTMAIAPTLSMSNNVLTVGPVTNTVAIPLPSTTSVTGGGAAVVTNTGSVYQVTVAPTTISSGTNVSVSGAYPDFTVSSTPSLSLLGPNTLSISGGNTVQLAPTIAINGNSLSVGPLTNYVTVPTPTLTGTGAASINPPVGLNYVIHVPATTLTTAGGGISIVNGGVNIFTLTVQSPTLNNGTNVTVTGSHPNFVINATPSLSLLTPNTLSITGGNSVPIAPTLTFNNNVLTVGPPTNTVSIPSSTTTIVGGGAVNVIPMGPPNSYSISAQFPTITSSGVASVTSSGNNFTVSVPNPVLSPSGQSISISQGTANSSVLVPSPILGINSNTLTVGTNSVTLDTYTVAGPGLSMTPGPNHIITTSLVSPTFAAVGAVSVTPASGSIITVTVPETTVTTTGIANVNTTGTNSFNVNVPAPSLNVTGSVITITQGTAITTGTIPAPTLTQLGTNNSSLTAGGNTIALNTYTVAGTGLQMNGTGPNYTITSTHVDPTIIGTGAASVSPSTGTLFNVFVPQTAVTATTGIATISSSGTNSFNIAVPSPTYNAATGALNTGTASTNITPTLQIVGNVLTVGPAGNTVPLPPSSSTIQQSGIAQVSPSTGNNFTVHVPPPSYNPTTGVFSQGTTSQSIVQTLTLNSNTLTAGPASNSVVIPNANVTGSNAAAVTSSGNSHTVNVPFPTITGTNNVTVNSSASNFTINVPTPTITGAGMAVISPTNVGNNFVVNVSPTYTASTGALGSGSYSVDITPPVTFSNNIVTVGKSSNSVNISGVSPWTQSGSNVVLTNSTSNVGIGTGAPAENLQVESSTAHASISIISSSPHLSSLLFGTPATHGLGRIVYNNSANTMDIFQNSTSRIHIDANGNVGLKTTSVSPYDLAIYNPGTASSIRLFNSATVGTGFVIGHNNFGSSILNYDNTPMQLATNGAARITIAGAGNVGIGTTAPTELLTVESPTASAQISIVSPSPQLSVLNFGYQGNHLLGSIQYNSTSHLLGFGTNGTAARMVLDVNGRVGIGSTSPQENLQVETTTGNAQISIVSPSPQVSVLNFGNTASHTQGKISYQNTGDNMVFSTSSTDRMVVTGIGRVGIGNMAPTDNLQVETTGNTALSIVSNTQSTLYFGNSTLHFRGALRYDNSDNSMNFWTNNTPNRIVINSAGHVGIGTASPGINPGSTKYLTVSSTTVFANSTAAIEIEGSSTGPIFPFSKIDFNSWGPSATTSTNVARIGALNASTIGRGVLSFSTRDASSLVERMRIDETGKVSIGSTTQNGTLQVVDGSQGAGKVLTSDASGNAKWMDVLPAGMVMAYAGSVIPTGWLICNGAPYPKTLYPNLFAAIGTSWGVPTNTADFYVPDMQGMFLRGVSGGSGNDPDAITRTAIRSGGNPGNNVGSVQQDQLDSHTHTAQTIGVLLPTLGLGTQVLQGPGVANSQTNASGGQETRPKNVYVYYIIKY